MSLIEAIEEIGCHLTTEEVAQVIEMILERDDDVDEDDRRVLALAEWLADNDPHGLSEVSECKYSCYGMTTYSVGNREYAVATDSEADEAQDAAFDNYIDECVRPELSGSLANYFDEDSWKRDAKMDGRGHALSSYDGNEYEAREFFIYRVN